MEMKKIFIVIPLAAFSLWTCKKEELPPVKTGETVFELKGQKSGQEFQLIAGINGYYMNSDFSNPKNSGELGTYSSKLMHYKQSEINESMEIIITNPETGPVSMETLEEILNKTDLNYTQGKNKNEFYEVVFHAVESKSAKSYLWDFGDGSTSNDSDPIHRYTEIDIEIYRVCLQVTYIDNCTDVICSDIFMPLSPCRAEIIATRTGDSNRIEYVFSANYQGQPPSVYSWIIGNSVFTYTVVSFIYSPTSSDSVDNVSLKITDANNCITDVSKNISVFSIPGVCMINFNYEAPVLNVGEGIIPDAYISVVYKTKQGRTYFSEIGTQQIDAFFKVLDSENYQKNEKGQSAKKVEINFSCDLYDDSGDKIGLRDITGTIAFSYPE